MAEVVEKKAANLVTGENRAEFMNERLRITPEKPAPAKKEEPKKDEKPAAKAEEKTEEAKPEDKGEEKAAKQNALNTRFSELTEARKKAEAKAETEAAARLAAERRAADAEAKLTPPKPEAKADVAPQRAQFTNDEEFLQALTDHRVEQKLAERDKKAAEEKERAAQTERAKSWDERFKATEAEIPEFKAKLDASPVKLTRELAAAVLESPVGPRILLHFAENPTEADRIIGLTVGQMLREVGKIEARLEKPVAKETVTAEPKAEAKVEISQAPAPINPLKGNGAAVEQPFNSKGEFVGTYAQWKAGREEGKIK